MNRIAAIGVCALALCIAATLAASSGSNPGGERETILASERAWAKAPVDGDVSAMAGFMSDDYQEIIMEKIPGSNQSRWVNVSKAEWTESVRSGREKYKSVDLRNLKVYFHADVATVTGEYSQTVTKDAKDITESGLYVNTWVKTNGKWRVVSSVFP